MADYSDLLKLVNPDAAWGADQDNEMADDKRANDDMDRFVAAQQGLQLDPEKFNIPIPKHESFQLDPEKFGQDIPQINPIATSSEPLDRSPAVVGRATPVQPEAPVAKPSSPVAATPYINPLDSYNDQLNKALADRNQLIGRTMLAHGASDMANAALVGAGAKTNPTPSWIADLQQQQGLKLDEINKRLALPGEVKTSEEAKQQLQEDAKLADPNSAESKAYRDLASKVFAGYIPQDQIDQASGTEIRSWMSKDLNKAVQQANMESHQKALEKEQIRNNNMIDSRTREGNEAKMELVQSKGQDKSQEKSRVLVQGFINGSRVSPELRLAKVDEYNVQKINDLANRYPNPDKMSNQEVAVFVSELAKVAKGGAPDTVEMAALKPDTLRGKMAGYVSKLIGSPTAAGVGDFINRYRAYANDLAKNAQDTKRKFYSNLLKTEKPHLSEEDYNNFKETLLGGSDNGSQQELSPEDKMALDWAKKSENQNNPNAQAWLAKHGQ